MIDEIDKVIPPFIKYARANSDAYAVETGSVGCLTQQHFAEESDINNIMKRFGMTREMPQGISQGVYGDFTGVTDYESLVERLAKAQEGFMTLPPEVRLKFGNDPGRLIEFARSNDLDVFQKEVFPVVAEVKEPQRVIVVTAPEAQPPK